MELKKERNENKKKQNCVFLNSYVNNIMGQYVNTQKTTIRKYENNSKYNDCMKKKRIE